MTTATLTPRADDGVVTREDPAAKPTRRRFTAAYKLAILEEYERCSDSGEKGALLRREGLYSSHIVEWRRAKEVGALDVAATLYDLGSETAQSAAPRSAEDWSAPPAGAGPVLRRVVRFGRRLRLA